MPDGTCCMPDCDRVPYCRGMCRRHYRAAMGHEKRSRTPATCSACGVEYLRSRKTLTTRCPPCARRVASAKQAVAKRKNWPTSKVCFPTCQSCGRVFAARRATALYCSDECRPKSVWPTRPCKDCGRPKELLDTYCRDCRRARLSASRKAHKQWRRAIERGVEAERIKAHEIYDRDGWRCGICKRVVLPSLAYPHPMSASLDHVVPLSFGGAHVRSNVQCAHLKCNLKKNDRVKSVQPFLIA